MRGPDGEAAVRLSRLESAVERLPASAAGPVRRRLRQARRRLKAGLPIDRLLARAEAETAVAADLRDARAAAALTIDYPAELPVSGAREKILAALEAHQVLIVCGDTGSGKSTQLPKLCLEAGHGLEGRIAHTQPRRIAARAVAARLAEETASPLGGAIGYRVRFDEKTSPGTRVCVMTDGLLLAEIATDPRLSAYDTLIVDEAHERSLNIDFLLGYLKRLLPERPELKLIVTSATIEPERFSRHLDDAPIIRVEGRTWPVSVEYRAVDEEAGQGDLIEEVSGAVAELLARPVGENEPRDVLVFLPGERWIRETELALKRSGVAARADVLPLYARLPAERQDRIFRPGVRPRVVLATNVAETSLTVPRIRYVVDTGLARVSRYSPRSKIQHLPIEKISRAAADQRKGRCGRIAPGVCVRLYEEEDYAERPQYTDSEILRTNLASVLLQMAELGLGPPENFPFMDPPPLTAVRDGYRLLEMLGALDADGAINRTGREMARLPLDPRLARALLEAVRQGVAAPVEVIVAALAAGDPRERPAESPGEADEAHRPFTDPRSDFLFFLNLWRALGEVAAEGGRGALARWCRERFLSPRRVREWQDVHAQLDEQLKRPGARPARARADYGAIHRALLPGFLDQIAVREERREYRGARDRRLTLFPGSALTQKPPRWLMAAELIETSRVFAHTGAMVKPRWIELAAPHLVRRSHADARFSPRSGSVLCEERVLLYGLVLAAGRTVPLAPVDPVEARRLFIHEGLVREQARSDAPVLADNASARRSIEALEARIRRRDVLVGDQAIYRLYDRVLPPEALDVPTFEAWLREAPPRAAELRFRPEDLKVRETPEIDAASYPDSLMLGANRLAVDYRFSPGAEDDGATLTVPLPLLRGVDAAWLGWLIPGWLAEKIEVLLRLLPKPLRRQVVPVPDTARALAELARPVADELRAKLALERWLMTTLAAERGIDVPADAWRDAELPAHLAFRVRVVGLDGEVLAAGRDIEALRRPCLGEEETSEPVLGETPLERSGLRDWLFGDLPERVTVERGALTLELYPALIDRGTAVDLRLMDDPHRAARATADGVLRLALLVLGQQRRLVEQQVARDRALVLRAGALGAPRTIAGDVAAAAFADVLAPADIRTQAAFEAALEAGRGEVVPVADRLQVLARNVLERLASVRRHLDGAGRRVSGEARADIERQLEGLVYPGFLRATPAEWRSELPRYLQAIEVRIEKLEHGHPSDRAYMEAVQAHEARLDDWRARHPEAPWPAELVRYRWMIEELRVSLFAQALGTRVRVSARRLDRQWSEIEPAVAAPRPAD